MKINWLWDTRLNEKDVRSILKNEKHPKFDIYAEKLLSRVSDPAVVFDIINLTDFCRRLPTIKKRIKKNRWLKDRVLFWQTIYERVHEKLKGLGIKIRKSREVKIPPERMNLAQQIRDIRMNLGYTQKEIAKKLGVIQQYVSKIESGRENVSIDTLKRIAEVFNKKLIVKLR
jgi:UDP-N-acetylglucosamine 1-carboxyvinyltransferase